MIYAAQRSSSNTSTGHDDKGWLHPGEYGRVGAWLKRAKRDLKMERERKGLAPSAVFEAREGMYKTVPAIDTPAGMAPPNPATGEAYIRDNFGTPRLNRSITFVEIPLDGGAAAPALEEVTIANPKFITNEEWAELHVWVHNWFLQRIPDQHQHLVSDIKDGDLADLLVKAFGLAARDPMEYCRTIKAKMKLNMPTIKNFDLVAHQWLLDQYDLFATINEANCMERYKMAPTDFVDHIIDILEVFMPKFTRPYRDSVVNGTTWNAGTLKTNLEKLTGRGQLKAEDEVRAALTANKVHADANQKRKAGQQTAYGVNDYTQSSFKRNGNKRNEYLGVRKKRSTQVLGVRNAILTGGEKKQETGPRRLKYRICDG
jgi:hypothetical protein